MRAVAFSSSHGKPFMAAVPPRGRPGTRHCTNSCECNNSPPIDILRASTPEAPRDPTPAHLERDDVPATGPETRPTREVQVMTDWDNVLASASAKPTWRWMHGRRSMRSGLCWVRVHLSDLWKNLKPSNSYLTE